MSTVENQIGSRYSLGSIKAFRGHEGETCLQGTILKDGKKVGSWSEDSWGGPMLFTFQSDAIRQDFKAEANRHPVAVDFAKEMEKAHGKASVSGDYADLVVSTIAQEVDLQKRQRDQLKRWCRDKIVFRMPDDPAGEYRTYKMRYDSAKHDAFMAQKHPGCEIMNKQFN